MLTPIMQMVTEMTANQPALFYERLSLFAKQACAVQDFGLF